MATDIDWFRSKGPRPPQEPYMCMMCGGIDNITHIAHVGTYCNMCDPSTDTQLYTLSEDVKWLKTGMLTKCNTCDLSFFVNAKKASLGFKCYKCDPNVENLNATSGSTCSDCGLTMTHTKMWCGINCESCSLRNGEPLECECPDDGCSCEGDQCTCKYIDICLCTRCGMECFLNCGNKLEYPYNTIICNKCEDEKFPK